MCATEIKIEDKTQSGHIHIYLSDSFFIYLNDFLLMHLIFANNNRTNVTGELFYHPLLSSESFFYLFNVKFGSRLQIEDEIDEKFRETVN